MFPGGDKPAIFCGPLDADIPGRVCVPARDIDVVDNDHVYCITTVTAFRHSGMLLQHANCNFFPVNTRGREFNAPENSVAP